VYTTRIRFQHAWLREREPSYFTQLIRTSPMIILRICFLARKFMFCADLTIQSSRDQSLFTVVTKQAEALTVVTWPHWQLYKSTCCGCKLVSTQRARSKEIWFISSQWTWEAIRGPVLVSGLVWRLCSRALAHPRPRAPVAVPGTIRPAGWSRRPNISLVRTRSTLAN
jgi:hypothetical protein